MRVAVLAAVAAVAAAQAPYQEVSYASGKLRIQAYLYKPPGDGQFPVVIYNHGSRAEKERIPTPFVYIGRMLTAAGYVVLVPERRGYGTSDGATFTEAVGSSRGQEYVDRLWEEAGDVLAALEYLKTVPSADRGRIGVMGWSLGGIVSVFGASRSSAFRAVVDQAGGALSWEGSQPLRKALPEAAALVRVPILGMVARNDRSTVPVERVVKEAEKHTLAKLIVYPPYTPPEVQPGSAPGHAIFAAPGARIWRDDVIRFLGEHLK